MKNQIEKCNYKLHESYCDLHVQICTNLSPVVYGVQTLGVQILNEAVVRT